MFFFIILKKYNIVNTTIFIGLLQQFFLINSCFWSSSINAKQILRCVPPSSHVCDFFVTYNWHRRLGNFGIIQAPDMTCFHYYIWLNKLRRKVDSSYFLMRIFISMVSPPSREILAIFPKISQWLSNYTNLLFIFIIYFDWLWFFRFMKDSRLVSGPETSVWHRTMSDLKTAARDE